jgi:hypothetical protein
VLAVLATAFTDVEALKVAAACAAALVDTLVTIGYVVARTNLKKTNGGFTDIVLPLILSLGLLAMLGSGCSVSDDWIIADDLTYKAIAPNYLKYLDGDKALDPIEKQACVLTVTTWGKRIEEWKKTNGLK